MNLPANTTRDLFDARDDVAYSHVSGPGLSEEVVRAISASQKEPSWMLDLRLKALGIFRSKPIPAWGPDLSGLDIESISYFARAEGGGNAKNWEDVPEKIKTTFDRLGIPEAEKRSLAGVGAQYDSEVVYHSLKAELAEKGVIFEDMSVAIHTHEALVREHFMKAVPVTDHAFAALHAAVWSGGTFLFVPKGVVIDEPLQAYFRMNVRAGGQFEHTLILLEEDSAAHYIEGCSAPKYGTASLHAGCVEIYVGNRAKMRYSSVENWSIDTYNLNTKRAIVGEDGFIEWVGGNLGSGVTMLYPCSVLKGDRSRAKHLGIAVASAGQNADTGAKVIHLGADTSSEVVSKSISKSGGISTYRGLVRIAPSALRAVAKVDCDGLVLDELSVSNAIPDIRADAADSTVAHEASAGKISEESLFYLQSRGLSETDAKTMVVNGFLAPVMRELPLEYAAELNILVSMEIEGF
jgi:Fe-S cluster assembly protein SufB